MAVKSPYSLESWLHTVGHGLLVVIVICLLIVLPIFWAFILVELWILQFLTIKHCFLTRFAHYRGVMVGMNYWEYVPYILGIKDFRNAGKTINLILEMLIVGILIVRFFLVVYK